MTEKLLLGFLNNMAKEVLNNNNTYRCATMEIVLSQNPTLYKAL